MNTNIKQIIKSLLALGVFAVSLSALAVWTPPESGTIPPDNNTPSPVHVGGSAQYKVGSLVVGGFRSIGLAIFNSIADFDSNVNIAGTLKIAGGNPAQDKILASDAVGLASWKTAAELGLGGGSGPWSRTTSTPFSIYPTASGDRITLPHTTDSNTGVIYKDGDRFLHDYGSASNSNNIFLGVNSGNFTTTGKFNIGIGDNTLDALTTGGGNIPASNIAIGSNALTSNTSGSDNTAIGVNALMSNNANSPNGGGNTAIGASALFGNTSGNLNTAVGFSALSSNTTGSDNVAIGRTANVSSGTLSNAIVIGASATVNASNKVRIGNSSITSIEGQVAWSYPSDRRLKKNIKDSDLGLDFINLLRPVSFERIDGDSNTNYGFIAQEVESLLGDRKTNIVLNDEGNEDSIRTMRYTELIAPMVKAIQEQQVQIEELKKEIEILKANQN